MPSEPLLLRDPEWHRHREQARIALKSVLHVEFVEVLGRRRGRGISADGKGAGEHPANARGLTFNEPRTVPERLPPVIWQGQ